MKNNSKDIRRTSIVDRDFLPGKKSKKKPFRLIVTLHFGGKIRREDYCIGKYAALSDAKKAEAAAGHKSYYTNIRIEED